MSVFNIAQVEARSKATIIKLTKLIQDHVLKIYQVCK